MFALALGLVILGACNSPSAVNSPSRGGNGSGGGRTPTIKVPVACRNEIKDFRGFYEIFRREFDARNFDPNEPIVGMAIAGRLAYVLANEHLEDSTLRMFEDEDTLVNFCVYTVDANRMRAKASLSDQEIIKILN
ncbi:MAG TPA: hypothetical protein VM901_07390, partial [Bdellovibrionota bacterium]|nr:hypothetical protein [Bdellovibrionota bacterium]